MKLTSTQLKKVQWTNLVIKLHLFVLITLKTNAYILSKKTADPKKSLAPYYIGRTGNITLSRGFEQNLILLLCRRKLT